jgi:DNA invertase Pin-like site-specific DNA recombinase
MNPSSKVTPSHLRRQAYLYIRQSTVLQTEQNVESTQRQYHFREQAVALGWGTDRIVVIDEDLGQSGAAAAGRDGFARLVSDVGLGQVGIVLALEVSRLARNCSDWHRLLEICALSDTLIMDEDGLYDSNSFNDRLLLGLRGTMSEAELHFLRCRLEGGKLNKAKRGELRVMLPAGFVYDPGGRVMLDPDRQVQQAIHCVFETFAQTQSAWGTVRQLNQRDFKLPVRLRAGPTAGEVAWGGTDLSRVLNIIRNPRYAGAYCYGRTHRNRATQQKLAPDQWKVLIRDAHEGYITWEQHQANLKVLAENGRPLHGHEPLYLPREGPALLQGLAICGRCGRRMSVRYHRRNALEVDYMCAGVRTQRGGAMCQSISGAGVDRALGQLVVEAVTPQAVEASLAVFEDLRRRQGEAESLYLCQIERARQDSQLAQRQFLLANPENRLVVDNLEKRWNEHLAALKEAEESYATWKQKQTVDLGPQGRGRVLELTRDFGTVWHHPHTSHRDRKRMLRLLIEDATLLRGADIRVQIRWRGGASSELHLPIPLPSPDARRTPGELLERIAHLAESHDDQQIAQLLNQTGCTTGTGQAFGWENVGRLRRAKGITGYFDHLRRAGWMTREEISERWGLGEITIVRLRRKQVLRAVHCDRKRWLYEAPLEDTLRPLLDRRRASRHTKTLAQQSSSTRGAV